MCGSHEILIEFVGFFRFVGLCLFINLYYLIARPPYWREYFLVGMLNFLMVGLQVIDQFYDNIYPLAPVNYNFTTILNDYGVEKCTVTNYNYTSIIHTLIWSQLILSSWIGYRTNNYSNKKFPGCLLLVGLLISIFSVFNLHSVLQEKISDAFSDSLFRFNYCVNQDVIGHLIWRFKPTSVDYFPDYLTYLVLCFLTFLSYDKFDTKIIGFSWLASLAITKLVANHLILKIADGWCLIGVIANLIIFAYSLSKSCCCCSATKTVKTLKRATRRRPWIDAGASIDV